MTVSFRIVPPVLLALSLSACAEHLDRREFASPSLGDAVARNQAIHVIDPWPPGARDVRIVHDGARLQRAVERYRTGQVVEPKGPSTTGSGGTSR